MSADMTTSSESSEAKSDSSQTPSPARHPNAGPSLRGELVMGALALAGLAFGFNQNSAAHKAAEKVRTSLTEREVNAIILDIKSSDLGRLGDAQISTDRFGYKTVRLLGGNGRNYVFNSFGSLEGVWDHAEVVAPNLMLVTFNSSDSAQTVLYQQGYDWKGVAHIPLYQELTLTSQHGLTYAVVNEGFITFDKERRYGGYYNALSYDDFVGRFIATDSSGLRYCIDRQTGAPKNPEGFVSISRSGHDVFGQRKDGIKVRV